MPVMERVRITGTWMRQHRWRTVTLSFLLAFVLANVWTYRHAWAMTHFSDGGKNTIRPEEMSWAGRAKVLLTGVNLPRPVNARTPAELDLAFTTHRVGVPDGVELEVWHIGHVQSRATVVMFHGYGASKAKLMEEARALHDLGCGVLLVDFRGSGGSTGNATTLGVYESADVAASFHLARELAPARQVILFGRSMGSVAILRAIASEGIEPDGVIMECPFDRLLGTVKHRFTAMGLPAFPCAQMLVFWGGVQHGMNGFKHNPVDYAAQVTCPALLMHGADDKRVSVAEARAVFTALNGEKQLEIFPGVGHESCHCTRPDLWTRHVAEFLDRMCAK